MGEGVRVGGVLVMVMVLADVVVGQEAFYNNYAFTKVMSECIGEAAYQDYQEKVAQARQECGGDTDRGDLRGTLFSSLLPQSFSINPFQGIPSQQPGGLFFHQRPTVIQQQHPSILQQPGIIVQQPEVLGPHQPGILQNRPGIFQQNPTFIQRPGEDGVILTQDPRTILNVQQPNTIFSQQPDIFSRQPNIFTQQPGSFSQPDGIFTQAPGFFGSSGSGIFSTGSSVTPSPDILVDSVVLPPVSPRLPGIRQKRALVLGSGEVERAGNKMKSILGNLTCVLQKLAVIDQNLNINYDALASNTFNLPIHPALKNDLLASIDYCRDMTLCLPVEKLGSPIRPQVQRLMAFVKCEKTARLSACLKHDLRKNLGRLNPSGGGTQSEHIERLLSYLVGAESASELELI